MKISTSHLIPLLFVLPATDGWAIDVAPLSFSVNGVVAQRPPKTVGPVGDDGPWRLVSITFKRTELRRLARWQATFNLRLEDCDGGLVDIEDIYIGEQTIGSIVSLNRAAFEEHYQRWQDTVQASVFVDEAEYVRTPAICASFQGGGFWGGEVEANAFVLK